MQEALKTMHPDDLVVPRMGGGMNPRVVSGDRKNGFQIQVFPKNMETPKWIVYNGKPY